MSFYIPPTNDPPPPGHQNGYVPGPLGEWFTTPDGQRKLRWTIVGICIWRTVIRHHEATGDWGLALRAGARAWVRWWLYFFFGLLYFVGGLAMVAIVTPIWVNMALHAPAEANVIDPNLIASQADVLVSVAKVIGAAAFYLLSLPYSMGVLWVRYADRSLFRVNHLRLYRWLMPFAYRMRAWPDGVLYALPIAFPLLGVGFGWLVGTVVGYLML
jgi:hypothetical protein